jgi:hypothetical protein
METTRENAGPSNADNPPWSESETLQGGSAKVDFPEEQWGKAQQRLILYLQFLKVPPFEVLELALEALKRARQSQELAGENPPVTAAIRAVRQLLLQRRSSYGNNGAPSAGPKKIMVQVHAMEDDDISRGIKSMPTVNRGVMVPKRSR